MVKFTKEPTHYDMLGAPQYYSRCGKYRILHVRTGKVTNGKAKSERWYVHYRFRNLKDECHNWLGLGSFKSKIAAKIACNRHVDREKENAGININNGVSCGVRGRTKGRRTGNKNM